ncbi:MAG: SDR family oxidoreductase, partial [Alphaproteobacteria bacterium]|nr:SDR family oxidoreductase [Alphaproteobacteria bacterium]
MADGQATAIVTGAGGGIGRATALRLARDGYLPVACDRDGPALESLSQAARAEGLAIEVLEGEVADEAHVAEAVAAATRDGRRLRALVNNAAVDARGSVTELSRAEFERTLEVNLVAPFLFARSAVPHMASAGGGAIVNVSSAQAFVARPRIAAYAATKGALNALTRAMAVDHGPQGIRVNAVCPGAVRTPLVEAAWARRKPGADPDAMARQLGSRYPVGRIGTP